MIIGTLSLALLLVVVLFLPLPAKSMSSRGLFVLLKIGFLLISGFVFFDNSDNQEIKIMLLIACMALFVGRFFSVDSAVKH